MASAELTVIKHERVMQKTLSHLGLPSRQSPMAHSYDQRGVTSVGGIQPGTRGAVAQISYLFTRLKRYGDSERPIPDTAPAHLQSAQSTFRLSSDLR